MLKLLYFFIKSKKVFSKPKKNKILIFDNSNIEIFKNYFSEGDYTVMETRKKIINIFVLVKMILNFKKINGVNYFLTYVNLVNPKTVLSFTDNHPFLYTIKNFFPNIKVITIQNGMRDENFFRELRKHKSNLKGDLILTWGNSIAEEYTKSIDTKTLSIGSFKNNLINIINSPKKKSILFISTGYEKEKKITKFSENNYVSDEEYYKPEKYLLPIIKNITNQINYKLEIMGRCDKDSFYEKKFYADILGDDNFDYFVRKNFKTCYTKSDESELTFNIYSAFGLETLARGNKCCFANVRGLFLKEKSMSCFWPGDFPLKGNFWTDNISPEEVKRIIHYSLNVSQKDWERSLNTVIPGLIKFDYGNSNFSKLLNDKFYF